jgi:hypothetical protein
MRSWITLAWTVCLVISHVALAQNRHFAGTDTPWEVVASEGVEIEILRDPAKPGFGIRYHFTGGAGYGGVFAETDLPLPENYEFVLSLHGTGPANNLEFKIVDADENVWWVNRRSYEPPATTTRLVNAKRHFHFAWGPNGGRPIERVTRLELVLASAEGGQGELWIDELSFRERSPVHPYEGTPRISTSKADDSPQILMDFGEPRLLGGVAIHWNDTPPTHATIEQSDDGTSWTPLTQLRDVLASTSWVALPDTETRFLRFTLDSRPAAGIRSIDVLDAATGASANALWRARVENSPAGRFPRYFSGAQSYWTILGLPGDTREAAINEEGLLEVDRGGYSIEPLILTDGGLLTWADGTHEQSLRDGWKPMPRVVRVHDGLTLSIEPMVTGTPPDAVLHAKYTLTNPDTGARSGTFVLAARPVQVLPPWQDLNITGGVARIDAVRAEPNGLSITRSARASVVEQLAASPGFSASAVAFDTGDPLELLDRKIVPDTTQIDCPRGMASGLLRWDFSLATGESKTWTIALPFGASPVEALDAASFEALAQQTAEAWSAWVERTRFVLPESARAFHESILATQAYILINHDGKGFQPGSRTYERSWIRDGSMTSSAMLELGHDQLVRNFVDWYADYIFPSGKVPCVVDRRGADPVPEHDSHGQYIWLVANTYRHTGDRAILDRHMPRVKQVMAYMESLRAERLTDEFGPNGPTRAEPGKPALPATAFRGLFPESISHEGYSAKPMHSFWDTFYGLRGMKDAAWLARETGDEALAQQWTELADAFRADLHASIAQVHSAFGIGYLPGCVELGDFDSTSSTVLIWPVNEADRTPPAWIDATFDRYWQEFTNRIEKDSWEGMTPYELRHINAYVRLGQKDRAWAVLDWLMTLQRPAGWRHWAEVAWRDRDMPRMIGDMPHTWCGSDFLNAATAMFAYEQESTASLAVLAGVPDAWFAEGFAVEGLKTVFGPLTVRVVPGDPEVRVEVSMPTAPPGGLEVRLPRGFATPDGVTDRVMLRTLPAVIELRSVGDSPIKSD